MEEFILKLEQQLDNCKAKLVVLPAACSSWAKPNEWNIVQVLQHLTLVDKATLTGMQSPNLEFASVDYYLGDNKLERIMIGMRGKRRVEAPAGMKPDVQPILFDEIFSDFCITRQQLISSFKELNEADWNKIYPHPAFGNFTFLDWLYFSYYHCARHLLQIEELICNYDATVVSCSSSS